MTTSLRNCNLLLCSDPLPQPDADGPTRRLFDFVEFLRACGCGVTCVAPSPQGDDALAGLGARFVVGGDGHAERLAAAESFDWAVLGSWAVAERLLARLRAAAPAMRIVIDAGDLHFRQPSPWSLDGAERGLGVPRVHDTVREIRAYAAADAVLTASRVDADLIGDLVGDRRRTFVVPDSEDLEASPFPFRRRRGILCVGDFANRTDIDALTTLGDAVLPHLDPAIRDDNPLSVAGSRMTDDIRAFATDWPTVRMLGSVPSVVPYLRRVRVALVPQPRGTRARRFTIRSLAIGTPVVTTSEGIEGLPLADEREVLVANDPVRCAAAIERLLGDEPLWNDLARAGRRAMLASHGHDVARRALCDALDAIRGVRTNVWRRDRARRMTQHDYDAALNAAQEAILRATPPGATIAVVSRGDEEAVRLSGRTGWHFPCGHDGAYSGFHPATGREAVEHVEAVRRRGADFLAIPAPSLWWLGHYVDLRTHLETRCRVIAADGSRCVLVSLRDPPAGPQSLEAFAAASDACPGGDERRHPIPVEGLSDRHVVMRPPAGPPPRLSIVIPTRSRASLLAETLDGLARQTAEAGTFEVVVVSDGSIDGTADFCRVGAGRHRLTLVESPAAATAVARNIGLATATAPLVLFLDDDVVADPELVATHLAAHRRHPLEHVAVLGKTAWHPRLPVTELMRFITTVGDGFPGGAPVADGRIVDSALIRSGLSCKRSLLVRAGGFRPGLADGAEDLEAGHRIHRLLARERPRASQFASDVGLVVVSCRSAVHHAIRPVTFVEVCERSERQGRALAQFSRVAGDAGVDDWLGVSDANKRWEDVRDELAATVARVRDLEVQVETTGPDRRRAAAELQHLYAWTFAAFRTKGIAEALVAA